MEVETAKLEFNTLKNSNIIVPFREICREGEDLVAKMEDTNDTNFIATNHGQLHDNTKRAISTMEHVTEDLLTLTDKLLKKAENSEALSGYRDWIACFKKRVQEELDANDWFKVQGAVYNKVRGGKVNYRDSEQKYISKLEELLKDVNMSIKDFELLILMKFRSNQEFHGNEFETQAHAKQRLQMFPKEIGFFKEPLLKLFNALEIWNV